VVTATYDGARPTMQDVAFEAGVSRALVSIIFRGAAGASEQTRERVFAAADRLGYQTNRTASLLASSRTRQLGMVVDLHNAFHADLVDAALAAADNAGYQIVLSPQTTTHEETRAITTALEFRCEALLLVGPELDAEALAQLTRGTPVVCIGRHMELAHVDVVRSAEDRGMEQVVNHLVELGHRRIAHIDGGLGEIAAARRAGFEQGLRRHRILSRAIMLRGGRSEADGRWAGQQLLRRPELPTAVAAFNDHCALGVIDTLSRSGLRIPQDISVTGYDDSPLAQLTTIDLTSVRQDAAKLAGRAVKAAVERLETRRTRRRESVLNPQLVVRGSSASLRV
jgi:DNA-binding LacI/PurR family transcriptional regulator